MNLQSLTNLYKPLSYLAIGLFLFQSCTQEKSLIPSPPEMGLDTQTQLIGESVAQMLSEPTTRIWLRTKFTKTENLTGTPRDSFLFYYGNQGSKPRFKTILLLKNFFPNQFPLNQI